MGGHARLRRAGADPRRAGGRARGRVRPRLPPLLRADRPARRSRATATRRSCGRTCPSRRPSRAATGVPAALDAVDRPGAREVARRPLPVRGDLGRAALAAAGGEPAARRERMVAVGAAAPVEVDTRTAGARRRRARAAPEPLPLVLGRAGVAAARRRAARGRRRRPRAARRRRPGGATPDAPRRPSRAAGRRPCASAAASATSRRAAGASGRALPHPRLDAVDAATRRAASAGCGPSRRRPRRASQRAAAAVGAVSRDRRLVRLDARTGRPHRRARSRSAARSTALAASGDAVWIVVRAPRGAPTDDLLRYDAAHRRAARALERHARACAGSRTPTARSGCWRASRRGWSGIDLATRPRRKRRARRRAQPRDMAVAHGAMWVTLADVDQLARVDMRTLQRREHRGRPRARPAIAVAGRLDLGRQPRVEHAHAASTPSSDRAARRDQVPLNPYERSPPTATRSG